MKIPPKSNLTINQSESLKHDSNNGKPGNSKHSEDNKTVKMLQATILNILKQIEGLEDSQKASKI